MAERTFDAHGRERRYSDQKRWLAEAEERLDKHVNRCIMCLRFEAGRGKEMCTDGTHIHMQLNRIRGGMALSKDPAPRAARTKLDPIKPMEVPEMSEIPSRGVIIKKQNGIQTIKCRCGNVYNRKSKPGRCPQNCTKCGQK